MRPPTEAASSLVDRLIAPAPRPQRVDIGSAVISTTRSAPTASRTADPSTSPWAIRARTAAGNLFDRRIIHCGSSPGQWCCLGIPGQTSGDHECNCRHKGNCHLEHFIPSRFAESRWPSIAQNANEGTQRLNRSVPIRVLSELGHSGKTGV